MLTNTDLPAPPQPSLPPARALGKWRILVAEDDPELRKLLETMLRSQGFTTDAASDGATAIEQFKSKRHDAVVTDIAMPHMSGIELLEQIRAVDPEVPVIVMTASPQIETAVRALEYRATRYLAKPVKSFDLVAAVRNALAAREARVVMGNERNQELSAGEQAELSSSFDHALDGLYMVYQPLVSVSRSMVYGYEALVRSSFGPLGNPALLFESARKLGRTRELGRMIRTLSPAVLTDTKAKLFVNVDLSDLEDEALYDPRSELSSVAGRVVIELTERLALDSVDGALSRIERLRALGFQIAIDDLGAGYSGLTCLSALEPDICKLDMSLIRGVDASVTKQKIVASLSTMCAELGITLVCEGVETAPERDALIALGCDVLQGYLFARPARELPSVSW